SFKSVPVTLGGAKGGQHDARLNAVWAEHEGEWYGTWTPTNVSVGAVYNAEWRKRGSNERPSARLSIQINGSAVTVHRQQPNGTCTYTGTVQGQEVTGTYQCSWAAGQTLSWSAEIGS